MPSPKTTRVVVLTALAWSASQFITPWLMGSMMSNINIASGGKLDPYFAGAFYNLFLGPAVVGGIAGYCTVILLRSLPGLRSLQRRTIVLISMAALFLAIVLLFPMSSLFLRFRQNGQPASTETAPDIFRMPGLLPYFGLGFFSWIIPGILIGLAIASEINRRGPPLTSQQKTSIAAGWGIGFALGGGLEIAARTWMYSFFVGLNNPGQFVMDLLSMLPYAINGFIAGLVSMWCTLRVIQAEITSPNWV